MNYQINKLDGQSLISWLGLQHLLLQIIGLLAEQKATKTLFPKIGIVLEEADESLFWLELIEELNLVKSIQEMQRLKTEANELVSIFVVTQKTIKARLNRKP